MTRPRPRHKNIKSPFEQSRQARPRQTGTSAPDKPRAEQLAAFDAMCASRPLKPPPGNRLEQRSHAAKIDARKARGG